MRLNVTTHVQVMLDLVVGTVGIVTTGVSRVEFHTIKTYGEMEPCILLHII